MFADFLHIFAIDWNFRGDGSIFWFPIFGMPGLILSHLTSQWWSELFINGKISFDTWVDGCWLNHLTWWIFRKPASMVPWHHPNFKIVHLKPLQPFNCWDCFCLLVTFIQQKQTNPCWCFFQNPRQGKMPQIGVVTGPLCFWNPSKVSQKDSSSRIPTKHQSLLQKLLNWNLKNEATWKMMLLFKGVIFRFH